MRINIYILFFIMAFSINGHSQSVIDSKEVPFEDLYTLEQVIDSLTVKAKKHNVNLDQLMKRFVDRIVLVDYIPKVDDKRILGKVVPTNKSLSSTIYVRREIFKDFFVAERVIAHELGHAFYLKHCCVNEYSIQIMAAQQTTNPETIMYQIAFKFKYEETFDVYFNEIKTRLNL